jgi:hypothetical protein
VLTGSFVAVMPLVLALGVVSVHAQGLERPTAGSRVDNQPSLNTAAQPTQDQIRRDARRFGVGVHGGIGLDPEIIDFGAHATFGSVFKPNLSFRPGIEVGAGEITTFLGINLDFVYGFPSNGTDNGWYPYVGAGPTFGLSHRGFDTDDDDVEAPNRFDFSDTDFNGGMNFIVGMRKPSGVFFEMKATAWGVSNIRLVAGFNF